MPEVCCRRLSKSGDRSPFSRIIVFDYYDGPLQRVAACSVCGNAYVYHAKAWEPDKDVRIFELRLLADHAFGGIVDLCSALGTPKWPVWVPLWKFQTTADERNTNVQLESLRKPVGVSRLILASEALEKEILAARTVDEDITHPDLPAWLRWLGLT